MKDGTWQNDGLIVGGAFRAGAAKKRGKTSQLLHLALKFGRQAPKTLVYPAYAGACAVAQECKWMGKVA
ncbi:MAG: hypothetical protein HYX45_02470 [Burkholderiales bacterium]|nr:hypothetical protein [Burkholderiales bacterium]